MSTRKTKPKPPDLEGWAWQAAALLWQTATDPETPEKTRIELQKWLTELWFGKGPLNKTAGPQGEPAPQPVRFEGVLEEWAK